MAYIDRDLMEDERIIYRSRLHWSTFIRPAVWLVAALALFGFSSTIKTADTRLTALSAGGLLALIALLTFIPRFIRYMSSDFGITNRRVIMKVGMLRRRTLEVLLNKVESIQVRQSTIGTVLRYGSITITGTGGTKDTFHDISGPAKFRKKVEEQIALLQDSGTR